MPLPSFSYEVKLFGATIPPERLFNSESVPFPAFPDDLDLYMNKVFPIS